MRRHFDEIFNRHLTLADELIADDYVEHAVAPFGHEPGRVNGPAAVRKTAEWLLAQFPDLHMTIEAIVAEGDTVAVRVFSEGTNLGPLNGVVPPTGMRFAAARATGSVSRTASWLNTGPPERTIRRCCNWASCILRVDRRPRRPFRQRR